VSLPSILSSIIDAKNLDQWSSHAFVAVVQSQNADHTYFVKPISDTLPDMPKVGWLGAFDVVCPKGQKVICVFDANGCCYIMGKIGAQSAEFVPLGLALVSWLSQFASVYNSHTHAYIPGNLAAAPTAIPLQQADLPNTSDLLSSTVRVEK
jgi:hypothetical protein